MTQPTIKVLGAYKVEMTNDEIYSFLQETIGKFVAPDEMEEQFILKRNELSSVVALDISIINADNNFDVGDFRQPDSDQVVYDEVYLSTDGLSIESKTKPSDLKNLRVYFFLHHYDIDTSLLSSYGTVSVPELQSLPAHLKSLHPFIPVD